MADRWPIDRERITRYLSEMVRIDSTNPKLVPGGAGETEMAAWLVETCAALGFNVATQKAAYARPNVIAGWRGSGGGRSLLLTGHTDIVGTQNMTIPPFEPRIEGGRLYGRGSFDMKGGLAAILGAAAALRDGGFQPAGDLHLGFVVDEEYASIGMDALVRQLRPDAAILAEPTDLEVGVAHRGFAWLTITTQGKAVHGSLYEEGVDAIAHMGRVLAALERMESETFSKRAHPLLGRPSVHASLIEGGLGLSTYPDACTLQIEHRLLPDETGENVLALWQGALGRLAAADPAFQAEARLDVWRPGFEIGQDAPVVQTLDAAYREVMGRPPAYTGVLAWLDSAVLSAAGVPTVILGTGGDGAHAPVEYVELEDVFRCAAIYAETAARWLSSA